MGAPKDPITGVTPQQEAFAQAVASGATLTDAYRQSYHVAPNAPGIYVDASQLAAQPNVSLRIQQIKESAQARIMESQAWTLERLVETAEEHRKIAVSGGPKTIPAANGALEIIGRATGLLSDKARELQAPQITRVVVVLNRGTDPEGNPRIVEQPAYKVLPPAPDNTPDGIPASSATEPTTE